MELCVFKTKSQVVPVHGISESRVPKLTGFGAMLICGSAVEVPLTMTVRTGAFRASEMTVRVSLQVSSDRGVKVNVRVQDWVGARVMPSTQVPTVSEKGAEGLAILVMVRSEFPTF
jgi:hypothetical protein